MSTLLEVQNLKKYFKVPSGILHAVDDVSFKIEKGHTLGVVGESGCGKSTLGRTINHLLDSTDGKILFEGRDITNLSKREMHELRRDMQMIFQDPFSSLNPRMTVAQAIGEPLTIYKIATGKEDLQKRVREIMDRVGLAQRLADSFPHELDGGRRQRIGIARALALEPKFIVCDEPVSALDVSIQAQILNLMQELRQERGYTYVFVTHDLSVVRHISHEICVMYLGRVVEMCPTKDLFRHSYHPYTQALLSAIPIPNIDIKRERILLKGEIMSPINPKPGCRFAPRCIYADERCSQEDPELREVAPGHFCACHYELQPSAQGASN
ncbi:MAG: ATP-binding cassette domain-containing protein [Clostridia bacterium]|nr:ATP-binding cassette domain-containing protein [Clostridia bacterium]